MRLSTQFLNTWLGALAVLFAAAMLAPGFSAYSLWYDEVNFLWNSLTLDMGEFWRGERSVYLVHPPGYFVVLKLWGELAGTPDYVFRALSVFWAVLTVALVYRLATDLGRGPLAGVCAALLLGAMGFFREYAHEVHNYAFFTMLSTTLGLFYVRWWRHPRQRSYALGIVVATIALLYTHYSSAFLIIALNIHALGLLRTRRADYARWFGLQALAGLSFAPWLPFMWRLLVNREYDRFGEHTVLEGTSVNSDIDGLLMLLSEQFFDTPLAFGALALVGLLGWLARPRCWPNGGHVLGWVLVVVGGSLAAGMLANLAVPALMARRMIFVVPFLVVVLGALLATLPRPAALIALLIFGGMTWNTPEPDDWIGDPFFRQIVAYVEDHSTQRDLVHIMPAGLLEQLPFEYYAQRLLTTDYTFTDDPTDLHNWLLWGRERLWVVWNHEPPRYILSMQQRGYVLEQQIPFEFMNIWVYHAVDIYLTGPPTLADDQKAALPHAFGPDIRLLDYQINAQTLAPDQTLTVWARWQANARLARDYVVFLHVLGPDGTIVAQGDGTPTHLGRTYSTRYWAPGVRYEDRRQAVLPADIEPGAYELVMGLYDFQTGARLGQGLTLTTLQIR